MNPARAYRVIYGTSAWREIMALSEELQNKIFDKTYSLELDPRPSGCKKLKGNSGFYRVRVGNHRVIYDIQDAQLVVLVVQVIDRKVGYD